MIIISDNPVIRLFVPDQNRLEGDAIQQLKKTGELPGMECIAAMPDLHPGKGGPVGAAFLTQDIFYPHLIGSDVGCGMGLWLTDLRKSKMKRDKWAKRLYGFEEPWEGDTGQWLAGYGLKSSGFDDALGTIGGGNHFAELQMVEQIHNQEAFDALGLDKDFLMLLVHSGSRGLGASLLRKHTDVKGAAGLESASADAEKYIRKHDNALVWAQASRALTAHRFLSALGAEGRMILDILHNAVSPLPQAGKSVWLHRKGVVPSDRGPVIVPGTRGSFTYLAMPVGDQTANLWSLAHGAGRKWNRSSVKGRLKDRVHAKSLTQTELGSVVICEDKALLYEEAPQAYKNIERVMGDMADEGLLQIIAVFRPLITYKTRSGR
ncbi:MAG: RNA ligase RtcB family protein [Desulfobacterales bacterium]